MKRSDSGKSLEYRVFHKEKRNAISSMLSLGSRGTWDIISVYPEYVKVIQCKSRGYLQESEKRVIFNELKSMPDNVVAVFAYRISRKKIRTKVIKDVGEFFEADWLRVWQNLSYFDKPRGIELKAKKESIFTHENFN